MFFRKRINLKSLSDEELVERYQKDDNPELVGVLFERYTHMVYLVCMKYLKDPMEAEDVSMQIFEKLLVDLRKYEVRKFKPWLHTVVKNQCLILLEKQKRERTRNENVQEKERGRMENEQEFYLPSDAQLREEQLVLMENGLKMLNQHQRTCLELFYLQQKSYQEVSDATGYSMKEVKSYIQNGKRNLKKHMESISSTGLPLEE
ncbi:MAG: RNA polymerase sigma factor [Bacteroidia bacterium]